MNDRKKQVLFSAQRLFVEKGFTTTSVQDILNEAQISKGTFYNYFSSKNECLIAILIVGQEETMIRRQELLIGRDLTDKTVLAEQISIRQQVNRDHNLFPIFEALFHSDDAELSTFAKKHHIAELQWLEERLINIYGEPASPYAPDCAVLMLGMLHYMQARSSETIEKLNILELVNFIIRRIDTIVPTMIATNDYFLEEGLLHLTHESLINNVQTKKQILKKLAAFQTSEKQSTCQEYISFLLDEINAEEPRIFLLETVTSSFRKLFIDTPYEFEARKLAANIWVYIKQLKEQ